MDCTNCGRPVAGPALLLTVTAQQADDVTCELGMSMASEPTITSRWVICPDCQDMAPSDFYTFDFGGFIRTVVDGLAKTGIRKP